MSLTNFGGNILRSLAALSLASTAPWWLLRNEHTQGSAPLRFESPAAGGRGCSLRRPGANPRVGREGPGGHLTWREREVLEAQAEKPIQTKEH